MCQLPVLVYICVLLESIPSDYPEPLEPAQELPWHHGDEFCHSYSSVSSLEQQHSLLPFAVLMVWGCTSQNPYGELQNKPPVKSSNAFLLSS